MAVTHRDVQRLAQALSRPAAELVEWLPPPAVDMTDEPGSFVELQEGRRLMVLRHERGGCHLLADQACSVYTARPLDCALFPFDLERDELGKPVRVSLLTMDGCSEERGQAANLAQLVALDAQRWKELGEYQTQVARWNRLVQHRRRFGRAPGNQGDLLAFLGLDQISSEGLSRPC